MVDVLVSGKEGYPCYRIPALLRLPTTGLLLLFAEGRFGGDMGQRTDLVYKSSNDGGRTWSPLRVLYSEWVPPGHSWHSYTKNTTFNVTSSTGHATAGLTTAYPRRLDSLLMRISPWQRQSRGAPARTIASASSFFTVI
jgi:hypothetical protein